MTQPQPTPPSPAPHPVSGPAGLSVDPQARLDWLFRMPQAMYPAQDLKAMVLRYRQLPPK